MPTYRKSLIGFRLVHLHLTLTHSKGQSQGHANFYCEYLVNGDRLDRYCYCQYIGCCLLALDCCIYIWLWLILKVKVKVMQIWTVNISKTVTGQILLFGTHDVSLIGFWMIYLHLIWSISKVNVKVTQILTANIL